MPGQDVAATFDDLQRGRTDSIASNGFADQGAAAANTDTANEDFGFG